ncbi:PH domain-containing protein [Bacillaceae bacterium W0354]
MSNPKRLHPTAIIFRVIEVIKGMVVGLLPLVVLILKDGFLNYVLLGLAALSVLIIISSIIHWLRFTYAIVGDEIRIEQGLFIRKKRYIQKNRIQSIDLTQGVIHRLFGLTKVQIETAGSDRDVDAALSSVLLQEGQAIRDYLKANTATEVEESNPTEYPKEEVSTKQLIIAGSTSGSLGVILGLFGFLFSQMESIIPEDFYNQTVAFLVSLAIELIVVLALIVVILLWALGILGTVIKYGKFTITRYENELFITRGLLEKKQMTIPLKRIQAVGVKESLIRQPFGLATIYVEIAGGETKEGSDSRTLLLPIIKKSDVNSFLEKILPEYQDVPTDFIHLPKRSLPYYLVRSLAIPIIALIVVAIFFSDWYLIPAIICGVTAMFGLAKYQTASYFLDEKEQQLTLVFRNIGKETLFLKHRRIQSFSQLQHIIHRKQGLASFNVSILNNFAGRHIEMKEMRAEDVNRIADWFSLRKK